MSTALIQGHLRKYAEDGIQQKVRLSNLVMDYKEQETKSRERIIDQKSLVNNMKNSGRASEKINLAEERMSADEIVLENVQKYLAETNEETEKLMMALSTHMEELTALEVGIGGFVTHPIGIDTGAKLNKDSNIVTFEPDGHIEIPIGTRMNSWKDSSQLTINKIKKVGR